MWPSAGATLRPRHLRSIAKAWQKAGDLCARAAAEARSTRRAVDIALGVGIFAASLAVYRATLAPGIHYDSVDSAELATVTSQLRLAHAPGYPLYTWLGKLFTYLPVGDAAYRLNLMSAVGAAGAAALLYGMVLLLTGSRLAGLFAGLLFAFSATLWSQAVIAEVYAPNAFMMALTLLLLVAWGERRGSEDVGAGRRPPPTWLLLAAFLSFGLSLGTHLSNLAFAPAIAVYVLLTGQRAIAGRWPLIAGVALFALGATQFVWLPLRASTLTDPWMLRHSPDSWSGFYGYTMDAFEGARFAFPSWALPDRVMVYLELAAKNLGWWGLPLGFLGMWEMLFRRPAAFYLLILVYLTETAFFLQYSVPDIEVFFLPAHLILAAFIGYGGWRLMTYASAVLGRQPAVEAAVRAACAMLLMLPIVLQLPGAWAERDRSDYTGSDDFYRAAFRLLPEGSTLVGEAGLPGSDLIYQRLVGQRLDVAMPQARGPAGLRAEDLPNGPLYTTMQPNTPSGDHLPGPADPVPPDLWYVPVLAAPSVRTPSLSGDWPGGRWLTLYRAEPKEPGLVVADAAPRYRLVRDLDGVDLLGFDLDRTQVEPGGTLHLTLYWRPQKPPVLGQYVVSTVLGDSRYRELHTLGFGLVQRYQREGALLLGSVIVEDYDLVVMSSTPEGEHTLRLGARDYGPLGSGTETVLELATIRVGGDGALVTR